MSTLVVTYAWSVPDTFDINFEWKIIEPPVIPTIPTILTAGPKNSIIRPTLTYPNGGEEISTREIEISWINYEPASSDNLEVWYEVYFTENYDYITEPEWKMIASVPSKINKFLWKVGNSIKSKKVRVGVRAVNSKGERSDMSVSADYFSIKKSIPSSPSVISPLPNTRYGSSIKFVFDDSYIVNSYSQRAKYYIYFSSTKAGIPFTSIAQNIPVGSGPVVWDTTLIPPSDDYVITVYLADDDGNKSSEVNIRNVSIIQEGFFLIDTKPPTGYIQINDADQFTRNENVSIKMYAYDEVTGVHSLQFTEENGSENIEGSPEAFANVKYWKLTEDDGTKTIKVKFQDYGGNRTSEEYRSFRVLFDLNNEEIADICYKKSDQSVWLAKNGEKPCIYKLNPSSSFVSYVNERINVLCDYKDSIYIAVETSDSTCLIYKWTGFLLEEIIRISDIDSEVISMFEYNGKMFFGCKNGNLYTYNESNVSLVRNFESEISRLYSDNSLLYIILRNNNNISVYDGNSFSEIKT